jgi:hypothetical protein
MLRGVAMAALLCLPLVAVGAVGIWSSLDSDPAPIDDSGGGGVPADPGPVPIPMPAPFPGLPDPGGAPGREPALTIIIDEDVPPQTPLPVEPAPAPPTTEP